VSDEPALVSDAPSGADDHVHRRTPVGEEIYEALLTRVLSSEWGPGDRITIDALGRELRVSQTPIREALHRLSADGVVVRTHMAGYRVAPKMTREQFEDLVEVRLLLEPAAARRAAERATPEDIARLRSISEEMGSILEEVDSSRGYATFSRLDTHLHDEVAVVSGNGFIRESLVRLHTHVHIFRLSSNPRVTDLAVDEHDAVLAAIATGDPEGAAYAMRRHIEASAVRFRNTFAEAD